MNISQREEQILRNWKEINALQKSITSRPAMKRFVFYEGPPTANGMPGLHHILTRSFKDVVCRYKTMRGYRVERRAGWDTHGLPVEIQVEKELGFRHKKEIERYGVDKFNQKCKESVWQYKTQWEEMTERMGFWVDMDDPYITYDPLYIESLWYIFATIFEKDLLYEGHKIVPFCTRCGTSLSSHEVAQGYEDTTDVSVYVKFPLAHAEEVGLPPLTKLLAWTTTPWTLPANTALAVGKDITYLVARQGDEHLLVAEDMVESVMEGEYVVEQTIKGSDLVGKRYLPPFDTLSAVGGNKFVICASEVVNTDEGTGVVHIAPMYGEDDYNLAEEYNLVRQHIVSEEGVFLDIVDEFVGHSLYQSAPLLIAFLKDNNVLYKEKQYRHSYPFCWRCNTALVYYARHSWFIRMSALQNDLLEANQQVKWVPSYIQNGRFGEWLEGVKDWDVARSRYWGTPLPIWRCQGKGCSVVKVIGSRKDLQQSFLGENKYFLMRHGYSEKNKQGIMSGEYPDKQKFQLLPKGIKEVEKSSKQLKKQGVDVIISSPIFRARQTAEILAKEVGIPLKDIVYDERLLETQHGALEGLPSKARRDMFPDFRVCFEKSAKGGETFTAIRNRMLAVMRDCEKKYEGKKIVLVGHGDPLWLLESGLLGRTIAETVDVRTQEYVPPGSYKQVWYAEFPYNKKGELDFHRPFVDNVEFDCRQCEEGVMRRDPYLADVWFDSGAMPFASNGYPFRNKARIEKGTVFPADFITEAIDQTRGWFYTLFAVSALMGVSDGEPPYRNAISLGHVLDEKGKKMSKSKGNIVDPMQLASVYGMDAVRWYFFTVNQPGDVKKFREKDIAQCRQKFLGTLDNSLAFLKTYAPDVSYTEAVKASSYVEMWILARLKEVFVEVDTALSQFDVFSAARAIDSFVIDDVSNWYIRRSRSALQKPPSQSARTATAQVLMFVLSETAKMIAPFVPFMGEYLWQSIHKTEQRSVHWKEWDMEIYQDISRKDKAILSQMETVRRYATAGLRIRAAERVRVRQPLSALCIPSSLDAECVHLLQKEVNVDSIVEHKKGVKGRWVTDDITGVELNVEVDSGLRHRGVVQDVVRNIQGIRRDLGLKPSDSIEVFYTLPVRAKTMLSADEESIAREVGATTMEYVARPHMYDAKDTISMDGVEMVLYVKK